MKLQQLKNLVCVFVYVLLSRRKAVTFLMISGGYSVRLRLSHCTCDTETEGC